MYIYTLMSSWHTYRQLNVLVLIADLVKLLLKYGTDVTPKAHTTVLRLAFELTSSEEIGVNRNPLEIPGWAIVMLNSIADIFSYMLLAESHKSNILSDTIIFKQVSFMRAFVYNISHNIHLPLADLPD